MQRRFSRPTGFGSPPARLLAALAATGAATCLLPFARARVGTWPAFLPIVATTVGLAGLITGFLLVQQYLVRGGVRTLALGATFLLAAGLALPQAFDLPAGPALWLWAAWHLSFAAGLLVATLPWPAGLPAEPGPGARRPVAIAVAAAIPVTVAVVVSFAVAAAGPPRHGTPILPDASLALGAAALASATWRGRRGDAVQRWLPLAALAALLDGLLNLAAPGRWTLGWYAGTVLSAAAAAVILAVLLHQVTELYRRLWDAHLRLLEESRHDFLTALLTRREGLAQLSRLLQQAERHRVPVVVGVLDIDHFKSFNDTHGHTVGDRVLEEVAARLRGSLRAGDFAFRMGGEEFGIVFAHATEEQALEAAWRILRVVRSRPVGTAEGPVTVTASIGVAGARGGQGVQDVIDRADQALYEAKRSGRDRVRGHSRLALVESEA